jgi:riboflavin kinase/FMN adenylyltransferase
VPIAPFFMDVMTNKMKIFKLNPNAKAYTQGTVITIGNFDGVHLGHQALIAHALVSAKSLQLPLLVIIFEPQPKEFFQGQEAPPRLFGLREKLWMLRQLSVDYVACIRFNARFSTMLPQHFFAFLMNSCYARAMVIGQDFYFGQGRSGSPEAMLGLAKSANIPLEIYDFHHIKGERVSSTLVRQFFAHGEFTKVEHFLSQPYFMLGRVIHGQGLGRTLGVPTANIRISQDKTALRGVFCVKIVACSLKKQVFGVANLGYRPSVNGQKLSLEVHLFDVDQDLYGQFLQVFFLQKLRDEQKFDSLSELKQQILQDMQNARNILGYDI